MEDKNYDITVIGAGPGGYVAAIRAAQLGARVLVVEKDEVGGVCLNRGCIPTKALIAGVAALKTAKKAGSLGLEIPEARIDLAKAVQRKDRIVRQLTGGIKFLFKKKGIETFKGTAVIQDKNTVLLAGDEENRQAVKTEKIIIATGSESAQIPSIPFDGEKIINSTDALRMTEVPGSILIIGAGAIGVEFAAIFRALGSEVTVVEMLPQIIPAEDAELAAELEKSFKGEGIRILTGAKVEKVTDEGKKKKAVTDTGEEIIVDKILVAVGRCLNSVDIGLEDAGISTERGKIIVNEKMETNVPGVYAIGDVVGGALLAHKASAEGIVAAENACGKNVTMDYSAVPGCIYTLPEVASVGMTEAKAKDEGISVKTGKFPFSASGKAVATGEIQGFVKVVAEAETGKILGVQIIGPHATDLIAEGVLAVRCKLTLEELSRTIHAHPTLAEAVMEAAEAAEGKAIHLP